MVSAVSGILVTFRRPFKIEQLSKPDEISSAWAQIRRIKNRWVRVAYMFFGIGVISEIIAMILLVFLG
jgi:hypothetical protein